MTDKKPTLGDTFESLTGAEDDEILERFGFPITELSQQNVAKSTRALIYITKRREGVVDADAFEGVRAMTMKDIGSFFAEEDEKSLGKDGTPEPKPEPSLSSVSKPAEVRPNTSGSLVLSGTSS